MRFFCEALTKPCVPAHRNAILALLRFFPTETPALIECGAVRYLLQHSFDCNCSVVPLTISLFTTLLFQSTSHTQSSILAALSGRDPLSLLTNKLNVDVIRSASRMIYVLASKNFISIKLPSQLVLELQSDPWAVAYLLATISLQYPIELCDVQSRHEIEGLDWSAEFVSLLLKQFTSGTIASRHFSSVILERLSHCEAAVDLIRREDLNDVANYVLFNRPKDAAESRPPARSSVLATGVLLNVWRRVVAVNAEEHAGLFASSITPLAAVIAIETDQEQSYLRIAQGLFCEMLALMASFEDLLLAVHGEETISTIVGLAAGQDNTGKEARAALMALSRAAPSESGPS
jgi:hypothetical protein